MMKRSELVDRFFDGAESGVASNMEIATNDAGARMIVGYNHAVYAYSPPDERWGPVAFTGWYGASRSTDQHMSMIEPKAERCVDGRPSQSDLTRDPELGVVMGLSSNDKDYSKPHSRRDRREGGV